MALLSTDQPATVRSALKLWLHSPTPAIAFMDEHLEADIDLGQIAAAARMSPRGLQAAFRREMGITPMAHLRAARLEVPTPTCWPPTRPREEPWRRWPPPRGFAHRGRFATAYRNRYGQAPATTVHT